MTPEQRKIIKYYKIADSLMSFKSSDDASDTVQRLSYNSDFLKYIKYLGGAHGKRIYNRYYSSMSNFCSIFQSLLQELNNSSSYKQNNRRLIYRELLKEEQAGNITINWKKHTIIRRTAEIVLTTDDDSVNLGEFDIHLNWKHLTYKITAVNPPLGDKIIHPHVKYGELCEGDGSELITNCFHHGFFMELFDTVEKILETYNGSSPHYNIDYWIGPSCNDCGDLMSRDDSCSCPRCEEDVCSNCIQHCCHRRCYEHFCSCCSNECEDCCNIFCGQHAQTRRDYDSKVICDTCYEEREDNRIAEEEAEEERLREEEEAEAERLRELEDAEAAEESSLVDNIVPPISLNEDSVP